MKSIFSASIFYLGFLLIIIFSSGCNEKPGNTKTQKQTPQKNNYQPPKINQIISLPKIGNIDTIQILIKDLKLTLPRYHSNQKDKIFEKFRKFYYHQIDIQNKYLSADTSFQNYLASQNYPQPDSDSYLIKYKNVLNNFGMKIYKSNGIYYIDELPNFIYNNFKDYVSSPMREFLNIRSNEIDEGFSENGTLLISFEKLGKRIITWERFLQNNPNFILDNEAKGFYDLYFTIYLTGMDNSPVFDKNGKLLTSVKMDYENFINSYGNSKSSEILKKYLRILSKNNYEYSKNINQFLKENKIGSSFGDQPPMR